MNRVMKVEGKNAPAVVDGLASMASEQCVLVAREGNTLTLSAPLRFGPKTVDEALDHLGLPRIRFLP